MEQLIQDVFEIIQDYRADEGRQIVKVTPERIKLWVNQFEEEDREFILTELKSIFQKRYCSKEKAKDFLRQVIERLATDFKYENKQDFLKNCVFLDLQPNGKSQKMMLAQLEEHIQEVYGIKLSDCGSNVKKHFIYIDDILCTGNTLFQDIKDWAAGLYSESKTNLQALKNNEIDLIFTYIFTHIKNYRKKNVEFRKKIDPDVENKHKMYYMHKINNSNDYDSELNFILPLEEGLTDKAIEYKDRIVEEVDKYTDEKGWGRVEEEFFREAGKPQTEILFSSLENRVRFENIMLSKGIEILSKASTNLKTMRALGYSLPSQKNFGFGTLCFTWRNIANNTPLVFWYKGGGFTPLFEKNQTSTQDFGNFARRVNF
jgi:hypothetical protein